MSLTSAQIRHKLHYQGPEGTANMKTATGVNPVLLERWMKGDDAALPDEDVKKLAHWCIGDYGMDYRSQGWVLRPMAAPETRPANVRAPLAQSNRKDYGDPANGRMYMSAGPTVASVGKAGKDLPSANKLIQDARRKADEEAEAALRAKRPTLRQAVTQALYPAARP